MLSLSPKWYLGYLPVEMRRWPEMGEGEESDCWLLVAGSSPRMRIESVWIV